MDPEPSPTLAPDPYEVGPRFGLDRAAIDEALRIRELGSAAANVTLSGAAGDRFDRLCGRPLSEILVALGALAEAAEDPASAIGAYDRGAAVDRGYVPFHRGLGVAHGMAGLLAACAGKDPSDEFARAVTAHDKAIALQPGDELSWRRRGVVRLHRQDWQGAVADLAEAIRLDPRCEPRLRDALAQARDALAAETR